MGLIMVNPLLRIEGLHTHFSTEDGIVKAVNGLDLTLAEGETLGLVGESGCGKSVTALSIMRLVQQPAGRIVRGRIFFEDNDLAGLTDEEMRHIRGNRISMIFQEPMTSLNPVFKIGNQIAETYQLHQGIRHREALQRSVKILAKVGIPDPAKRINEYPHQMSGGMRQRVMIAMALACNPDVIIADEPTTALDVTIQSQILDLMNQLKLDFGASILLITHDLGVVAEMAQRVAVMYAGKIVEQARVADLFAEPKHPYTLGLMASIPKLDEPVPPDRILQTIPGVVPNLRNLPPGCAFQDRCIRGFERCFKEDPIIVNLGSDHQVRCWLYAE
jgi:peptide/nickel transport system ATP-binding protein